MEKIEKSMMNFDTKETVEILESLDENSKLLARTYLTALLDRQQIEKLRMVAGDFRCKRKEDLGTENSNMLQEENGQMKMVI